LKRIHGIVVPVATPMHDNEDLDLPRLRWFLDHLLAQGVHGLFVLASNSEFYALDEREKQEIVATAVAHVGSRAPVVVGTGAETTREAIRLTKMAEREGADAVAVVTPYYVSPSQHEIAVHYRRIAESTALPLLLYNNPSMTGSVSLQPDTVARLAELPNVVGIKDSSGDLQNTNEYIRLTPERFTVLQGRDTLIFVSLMCGARGAVPASANVAPALCVQIYEAFVRGDYRAAKDAQQFLNPVRLSLALGTPPGAVKSALAILGMSIGPSRSPISGVPPARMDQMRQALKEAGLLGG
jgi:4-hydroxy-tetrahydrodipicolinate synthase